MILIGLVSNDAAVVQQAEKLFLYNHQFSIAFCCTQAARCSQLTTETPQVDILIFDVGEDLSALLAQYNFQHLSRHTQLVAIAANNDAATLLKLIKEGFVGFITKPFASEVLLSCVQNVSSKKSYISESLLYRVFNAMHLQASKKADLFLSERECQIIELISKGHTNKEIGEKLHISHHTVNQHLKKVYRKFNVTSRGKLIHALVKLNYNE